MQAEPQGVGADTALVEAFAIRAPMRCVADDVIRRDDDNVAALRFCQRRDFVLTALQTGAVDRSRVTLKPEIPQIGGQASRIEMNWS